MRSARVIAGQRSGRMGSAAPRLGRARRRRLNHRHPTLPPPPPTPAPAWPSPSPPRSFLAELEMRLHLAAEDVGLYLQDHAARAQQRIPAAAKELLRIQARGTGGWLLLGGPCC